MLTGFNQAEYQRQYRAHHPSYSNTIFRQCKGESHYAASASARYERLFHHNEVSTVYSSTCLYDILALWIGYC